MSSALKPVRVPQLEGGLDLREKSIIPDNALSVATNVFYNADKKLQTRRGKISFGRPIPDAAKIIHNCDSVSANGTWAATGDAVSLTVSSSQVKRGSNALIFNVTVATTVDDFATLTNPNITAVDISTVNGSLGFWVFVPTGAKTNLTNLKFRIGSDSTNYYEFTFLPADVTENQWNYLWAEFADSVETGTVVDTAIDYLQFTINYTAGYTDKTGWGLDEIDVYSSTFAKGITNLKYFKSNEVPANRYLLAYVGTSIYEYVEAVDAWNLIKTGLSEGNSFGFTAYKNVMYLTNGVDNYMSYNGVLTSEHTGANTYKGKYLLLANDVGYILGDPTVPSSLAYTNALPTNLNTFPNVLILDEDDSSGKGTGLTALGPIVIATKEKKIYKINVATPSREPIDYSEGAYGNRAILRVENEVFYMNESGVYTLAQREATIGSLRADPLSEPIQSLIDEISRNNLEDAAGFYNSKLNNAYFWVDTNNDGINDTTLVFSILTKKWTKYTGLNANEAVVYEDDLGVEHFLIANALTGQIEEIEYGTSDNGNVINYRIESKNFDFDIPEVLKTYQMVEYFGFCNETALARLWAIIDDTEEIPPATLEGVNYVVGGVGVDYALGAQALGTSALGGGTESGAGSTVTLYPFKLRIPMYSTGSKIRLVMEAQSDETIIILSKFSIYPVAQPLDVYEYNLIA